MCTANDEVRGLLLSGAASWLSTSACCAAAATGAGAAAVAAALGGFVQEGKETPRRQALRAAVQVRVHVVRGGLRQEKAG
jgi:hypothetical protein